MKIVYALAAGLLLFAMAPIAAAQDSATTVTYNFAFPQGETKDFIDSTSYRGVGLSIRHFTSDNFSIGGGIAWQVFDYDTVEQISLRTEEINGDVTGAQFRYLNSIPLTANLFFWTGDPDGTRFFVGVNSGIYWIEQRLELGTLASTSSNWQFGVAPEAGVTFRMGRSTSGIVAVRYDYAFKSGTSLTGEGAPYSYFGINLGLVFHSDMF